VPSRYFRHDCARLIGFRNYLALDLIAPPAPTTNSGPNINATAPLRSVNYMVNHICKPIRLVGSHLPDHIKRCKMGSEHRLRSTDGSAPRTAAITAQQGNINRQTPIPIG
jgi:hypothetical protein